MTRGPFKIEVPVDGGDFELEIHLTCAICDQPMTPEPKFDRAGLKAFVCLSPHASVPVHVRVKVRMEGVDSADAWATAIRPTHPKTPQR